MNAPSVLTISQLNMYVKSLLDGDPSLNRVFVSGEVSNFTNHYRSGHLYLSLKDEKCVIKAVMFSSYASRLRFEPKDGMKVLVLGRVSLYEQSGQYQLYIEDMQPDGLGALNLAYEQLKEKLAAEGLFDTNKKQPLPEFPNKVGVITSPTGAVIHDIQQVMARRYPLAELVLCPVKVQGEGAAEQVVQAIKLFNRKKAADVLIVGRGGGSMEDLWAFNEEKVAHAVAASSIPIISAVGHETDVTICDFVADCRAATPSAAAELAVPDQLELKDTLRSYQFTLTHLIRARMRNYHEQLHRLVASKSFQTPQTRVAMETMRLDRYTEQLSVAMKRKTEAEAHRLSKLSGQLHTLSPLQVLSRGYAITQDKNQQTIKSTAQVCTGQQITVTLSDGVLDCTVDEVKCNE